MALVKTKYAETLVGISKPGVEITAPIAMFDLDDTLQYYKNKDVQDRAVEICEKLTELSKTHSIVVYSNRKTGNMEPLERFVGTASFPCTAFGATGNDCYRKPHTMGVTTILYRARLSASDIEFYCGDAAGRQGDFAGSDRALALNLGVPFKTPEEWLRIHDSRQGPSPYENYFHFHTGKPFMDEAKLLAALEDCAKHRVVIVVGLPCSGKSTFAHKLQRYAYENSKTKTKFVHISRDPVHCPADMRDFLEEFNHDKYETEVKMATRVEDAIRAGYHVVIETNWKIGARFENLIRTLPKMYTLVEINTAPWICHHLNALRARDGDRDMLPSVAISTAFKRCMESRQDTASHTLHVELAAAPPGENGFAADVRIHNFPSFPTPTYA